MKLAAQTFARIRIQSWDIALADPAPTFLELNFGGDLDLHQLAHGQGVLDDQYRAHLRRCDYRAGPDLIFDAPFAQRVVSISLWRSTPQS